MSVFKKNEYKQFERVEREHLKKKNKELNEIAKKCKAFLRELIVGFYMVDSLEQVPLILDGLLKREKIKRKKFREFTQEKINFTRTALCDLELAEGEKDDL